MKKFILFVLCSLFMCEFALAKGSDQTFSIYVTNSTPHAINLLNSNYNETPINYITHTVTPGVQQLKVATVKMIDGKFNISFFGHLGNDVMTYSNTALVTYFLNSNKQSLTNEPATITVEGQSYSVLAQYVQGLDDNQNSFLLTIYKA